MPDAGVIVAVVLGALFVCAFYWGLVVVPRRHRQFYESLRPLGFVPLTKENESHVQGRLRELFPHQVTGNSPFSLPRIAVKTGVGAMASRMSGEQFLMRTTMQYGQMQKNSPAISSTIFLEATPLPIEGDFYVVTKMFGIKGPVNSGGDLHELTHGIHDDFSMHYMVLSPNDFLFPESLQRMLVEMADSLVVKKAASKAVYVLHLRFNRSGWSMEALGLTSVELLQQFHTMACALSEKTAGAGRTRMG